jgi:hypothetical protein
MAWFDNNRLPWPDNGDVNAWADFVESICLFNPDRSLSIEEFSDFLLDDATKTNEDILAAINFNEQFMQLPVTGAILPATKFPAIIPVEEEEEDDFEGDDTDSEESELIRSRLLRLFHFLNARKEYFGAFYPFTTSDNSIEFEGYEDISLIKKLYLVLLFSSQMNFFPKSGITQVGHMFEYLCHRPFNNLVPALAEKRFFGAGGGTIMPSNYPGNLKQKIIQLASDLKVSTHPIIDDPDELGPGGDAGLDWVAWISFEDDCDHQPLFFGQCACGANWVNKQDETAPSHWRRYLNLNQAIQCIHFMPRSFRRKTLAWFRASTLIGELTIIDRFRMLQLLKLEGDETLTEMLNMYSPIFADAESFEY